MKKSLLALAAVLMAGTVAGTALAVTHERGAHSTIMRGEHARIEDGRDGSRADARPDGESFRVADDHRRDRERHHGRKHHRDHDDDDDDDDRRGGERAGRQPATGPSDPTTPVPDNGLFQGKARPKVEVN